MSTQKRRPMEKKIVHWLKTYLTRNRFVADRDGCFLVMAFFFVVCGCLRLSFRVEEVFSLDSAWSRSSVPICVDNKLAWEIDWFDCVELYVDGLFSVADCDCGLFWRIVDDIICGDKAGVESIDKRLASSSSSEIDDSFSTCSWSNGSGI